MTTEQIRLYEQILAFIRPFYVGKPCLIGCNGPQGAGKTTLTTWLTEQLNREQIPSLSFSIDDFYLPRKKQLALAHANPNNTYLQQRGYPGTHDIQLGQTTIQRLLENKETLIPRYNKSAYLGQGDQIPQEQWQLWPGGKSPLVLLEGWMLGFQAISPASLTDPALAQINTLLSAYARWLENLDAFIYLKPKQTSFVLNWRVEAERKRRESGAEAMSEADAKAYIEKFIPAYEIYAETITAEALHLPPDHFLSVSINQNRLP